MEDKFQKSNSKEGDINILADAFLLLTTQGLEDKFRSSVKEEIKNAGIDHPCEELLDVLVCGFKQVAYMKESQVDIESILEEYAKGNYVDGEDRLPEGFLELASDADFAYGVLSLKDASWDRRRVKDLIRRILSKQFQELNVRN